MFLMKKHCFVLEVHFAYLYYYFPYFVQYIGFVLLMLFSKLIHIGKMVLFFVTVLFYISLKNGEMRIPQNKNVGSYYMIAKLAMPKPL